MTAAPPPPDLSERKPRCRKHEWGYVDVSRKVEVYHASPVGGFCIRCGKVRHHNRYGSLLSETREASRP